MAFRLALTNCVNAYEGPWHNAKGNEKGLEIIYLLEGERIELELSADGASHKSTYSSPGLFPFPQVPFNRYRVNKQVDEGVQSSPTIVRVQLNGIT